MRTKINDIRNENVLFNPFLVEIRVTHWNQIIIFLTCSTIFSAITGGNCECENHKKRKIQRHFDFNQQSRLGTLEQNSQISDSHIFIHGFIYASTESVSLSKILIQNGSTSINGKLLF